MATSEREATRELREATEALAEQPRARQAVIKAFSARALRSAIDESRAAESVEELRDWADAVGALLTLDREHRGRVTALLRDALDGTLRESGAEPDAETLEQWGRLQVLAGYERVRDESYTVAWLERHGVSRQRLNQWRRAGKVYGVAELPGVKGYAYPRWQFSDALRPREWLPAVVEAAQSARLDGLTLHRFMTDPGAGDGRSPLEVAESGDIDTAVRLVAAANAQGA
jgi:hypothetical protein